MTGIAKRVGVALLLLGSAPSFAFTLESPIGKPCHERITSEALRRVRQLMTLETPPLSHDEELLLQGLPFNPDADVRDLSGVTLLIGVRDPDLKGLDPTDLQRLASVHGHEDGQREHCLRRPEHDGAEGTTQALAECRAFIRESARYAVEHGLDSGGRPDAAVRARVDVFLNPGGPAHPALPLFWVYAGQALHTTQDSFTHTFRDGEARVDAVLNWVDFANDGYDERRDGPAHDSALDQCEGSPGAELRYQRAVEASVVLLSAMLMPGSAETKAAAIDATLDTVLAENPSCDAANRWCDASERPMAGGYSSAGAPLCLAALALLGLKLKRRAAAMLLAGAALAAPLSASAEPAACVPGQQVSCACPGGSSGVQRCAADAASFETCLCAPAAGVETTLDQSQELLKATRFGLYVSTGVSIDNTAFVVNLAGRYHLSDVWLVGVGVEWNPWFSVVTKRMQPGTVNVYASLLRRWPITERFAARTSAHLGASALLFNLYGAPAGNIGVYAAFNFIGLEVRAARNVLLVIDPCEVSMPVPHLTGVPITYRQYRFTIGVQFGG